jgi:Domain of unknown function (DUF4926)
MKFKEGDIVASTVKYPSLGLAVGDKGTVWCVYGTLPPSYEVNFTDLEGKEWGMICEESEIAIPKETGQTPKM